jgi:hypothetical protein
VGPESKADLSSTNPRMTLRSPVRWALLVGIGACAGVLPLRPTLSTMPVLRSRGSAVDAARSPTNVRVVPDLGDELLIVIDRLEALLRSVAVWEIEDDVGLPAPFADGKALGAMQTVADVVRPTQGRGEPQLVSGRLPRRGWTGRRLPLHFVPILDARSVAYGQHAHPALGRRCQKAVGVSDGASR